MADLEPSAKAGNEDDYIPTRTNTVGKGWSGIFSFLNGVRGVTDRVEGITDDVAGIGTNIVDTKRQFWELNRDKQIATTDDLLTRDGWERGDNIKKYYVIGAVALGGVVLLSMR